MMGYSIATDEVPVVKATNCLLVGAPEDVAPRGPARACIRCGECARVCPAQLLPQQLMWHARADDLEKAEAAHLFDCIECGCCDLVCPSHIPLTRYFRYAKAGIWAQTRDRVRAERAKRRFDHREARLEQARAAKRRRLAEKSRALNTDAQDDATKQAVIDEIMQRVKDKKKAQAGEDEA
jgi:electron transport complex protein RnfC